MPWDDVRAALLPVYRRAGIPDAFINEAPGAIERYGFVAASTFLSPAALLAAQREASADIDAFEAAAASQAPC